MIWTGTVSDWYFGSAKVTVKLFSAATETEQGVLQVCPVDVLASAPGGSDSICTVTAVGVGLNISGIETDEQPARPRPAATTTKIRMMHPPNDADIAA